ncbi:unnamed protein product, partial [Musa hybrid cultivar]
QGSSAGATTSPADSAGDLMAVPGSSVRKRRCWKVRVEDAAAAEGAPAGVRRRGEGGRSAAEVPGAGGVLQPPPAQGAAAGGGRGVRVPPPRRHYHPLRRRRVRACQDTHCRRRQEASQKEPGFPLVLMGISLSLYSIILIAKGENEAKLTVVLS